MKINIAPAMPVLARWLLLLVFAISSTTLTAQVEGIRTGASFTWSSPQPSNSDPAQLESVEVNGTSYNTFAVPSGYSLIRLGPAGHTANRIFEDGTLIVTSSAAANWDAEALGAYQSLNLNYYFACNGNGANICENEAALATTNAQVQAVTYSPALPVNDGSILLVTERNANNCQHISLYGIPPGGGPEQLLGQTFVRHQNVSNGPQPNIPPQANSDYWLTERVNHTGGTIGIALYNLTDLAPEGSQLTEIRFTAATVDVADGKFLIMQEYAVDDTFDVDFNTVFNGDVGANDNVPDGSTYTATSSPSSGTLTVNSDGTFSYEPDPDFVGTDTFTIEVCLPAPNTGICETSTVTLNVKPGVSINDAIADEGNNLTYTISISTPLSQDVDFNIGYTDISTSNADYSGPTTVTLPANASSVNFNVAALDDAWVEGTETLEVVLTNPADLVTFTDDTGLGTINDTDAASVITEDYTFSEADGNVQLRVRLVGAGVDSAFTVDVTLGNDGSLSDPATAGTDYTATTTTTLTFPANSPDGTEFFIPVSIVDDGIIEPAEQFIQQLDNLVGNNGVFLGSPEGIV
ncbi:Calx-beta domain-containing protein, partial [Flagellimonas sp. DF-77]|uniref:Calx-beta domain-containing protein n=1 Tax=Flagellimonas algarum TaxID=3230298 RepID=UPI003393A7B3